MDSLPEERTRVVFTLEERGQDKVIGPLTSHVDYSFADSVDPCLHQLSCVQGTTVRRQGTTVWKGWTWESCPGPRKFAEVTLKSLTEAPFILKGGHVALFSAYYYRERFY